MIICLSLLATGSTAFASDYYKDISCSDAWRWEYDACKDEVSNGQTAEAVDSPRYGYIPPPGEQDEYCVEMADQIKLECEQEKGKEK